MRNKIPNVAYVLKQDLCVGCGICRGSCPSHAISIVEQNGEFRPKIDSSKCRNSKGCHLCYDVCPGLGVNLVEAAKKEFDDDGVREDRCIGRYLNCYTGYSNDSQLRFHAASGGCVSQFLIWLLENKKIDGAIVTKFSKDSLLKVKSFIATTREDIIVARSSKYAPTSFYEVVPEIKKFSGSRLVVVGVPCQIEGMRKLMSIDKKIREKVCGLFSVYCSGSRTFNFTEFIMKERKIDLDELDYLAYRDNGCLGGLVAKGPNIDFYEDYQSYCHPLRSIFIPRRCTLCVDHFGELSDLSFGDIHIAPYSADKIGINSIVARTSEWKGLLEAAAADGALTLDKLDTSVLLESQKMAKVKKSRNVSYGLLLKKLGRKVPDYGSTYSARLKIKTILDFIQIRMQQFIGRHKKMWFLIPLLKGKVNIH